jgi:hypothetical protein
MHKQAAPWRHEELRWESRQALTDQAGFAPNGLYERIDDQRMSAETGGRVFAHMIAVRGVPDHSHAAQSRWRLDAPQL